MLCGHCFLWQELYLAQQALSIIHRRDVPAAFIEARSFANISNFIPFGVED
jgi:hypothetical protein